MHSPIHSPATTSSPSPGKLYLFLNYRWGRAETVSWGRSLSTCSDCWVGFGFEDSSKSDQFPPLICFHHIICLQDTEVPECKGKNSRVFLRCFKFRTFELADGRWSSETKSSSKLKFIYIGFWSVSCGIFLRRVTFLIMSGLQ